jgi:hypothetical protein
MGLLASAEGETPVALVMGELLRERYTDVRRMWNVEECADHADKLLMLARDN